VVTVVKETSPHLTGQLCLRCTCKLWTTHGFCCHHIYAVLQRLPLPADAKIRWWNIFYHSYGREGMEELSAKLHFLHTHGTPIGVPLSAKGYGDLHQWPIPPLPDAVPEFFASTLHTAKLHYPSYWTTRDRRDAQGNPLLPESGNISSTVHGWNPSGCTVARHPGVTEELTQTDFLLPSQLDDQQEFPPADDSDNEFPLQNDSPAPSDELEPFPPTNEETVQQLPLSPTTI